MNQATQEKITQLQNYEQNINTLIGQKQQYQAQAMEIDNALSQVEGSEKIYRIVGNIMVASSRDSVKKDLEEKKEVLGIRLKTIDKQEEKLRAKATELQQEILKEMKSDKNG